MKETAYIRATKSYGGFARHGCMSLIMPNTANALSHNVEIEWRIKEEDEGSLLRDYAIERLYEPCGSGPIYQISGPALDNIHKDVNRMVEDLMSNGFHITEPGSYWYNLKLVRDWDVLDTSSGVMVYRDIDKEDASASAQQGSGSSGVAQGVAQSSPRKSSGILGAVLLGIGTWFLLGILQGMTGQIFIGAIPMFIIAAGVAVIYLMLRRR